MASLERQHFWGCTLTKEKPEVKWLATENKQEMEVDILNQLALSQACLGAKANDNESHVVQVITTGVNSNVIKQPIIILGNKVKQVQCRLEFSAAATFKLVEGRGPVYLSGSHVQVLANEFSGMEDESEDEIPKAIPAGKPLLVEKHPSTSPNKQPAAKRAKLDLSNDVSDEDSDNDEDSEEEEGDEPTELIPLKGAKPSNKPKNTKTPLKNGKPPQKKNEKSNLAEDKAEDKAEEESGGSVDEDESEEDDANDDDFDAPDSDEDDDDDDDDGDDDDDDDDDDDSDEESGLEDEITNTIVAKKKLRNQQNEKTTPEKRTPRKAGLDASIPLQKTPDITTVKQRLLKSPNLPKSMDKFKNFMKTNMKITEDKTVKELWTWLKKNKK